MYPAERSLVQELKDEPFALIGVNSDVDLEEIRRIKEEKNLHWRSFWNGPKGTQGPLSKAWNVTGWPTVVLIDADGRIRYKNPQAYGVRGTAAVDAAVRALVEEVSAASE